jgi:hypothetical protein
LQPAGPGRSWPRARWIVLIAAVLAIGIVTAILLRNRASATHEGTAAGQTIQQLQSAQLTVVLKSDSGALHQGRNVFFVEFRSVSTGALVDVGEVRLGGAMTMPGMAMSGGIEVQRTDTSGRYRATADFGMAGAWRMTLEWNGPAGSGSLSFNGDAR